MRDEDERDSNPAILPHKAPAVLASAAFPSYSAPFLSRHRIQAPGYPIFCRLQPDNRAACRSRQEHPNTQEAKHSQETKHYAESESRSAPLHPKRFVKR